MIRSDSANVCVLHVIRNPHLKSPIVCINLSTNLRLSHCPDDRICLFTSETRSFGAKIESTGLDEKSSSSWGLRKLDQSRD